MISGMFPSGLKPRLKFAMMGQHLNEFAAILWGQTARAGSTAKNIVRSDNSQINALR
jgi:hypothetical protein